MVRRLRQHALKPLSRGIERILFLAQHSEVEHRIGVTGGQAQGVIEMAPCQRRISHAVGGLSEIQMDIGIGGVQFDRARKGGQCGVVPVLVQVRNAQAHEYGRGRAGKRCGTLQCLLGVGEIPKHQVREPEIFEGGTVARLSGERLLQGRNSIVCATRHEQRYREQDQRVGIARCALQYVLADQLSAGGVPRLQALVRLTQLAV